MPHKDTNLAINKLLIFALNATQGHKLSYKPLIDLYPKSARYDAKPEYSTGYNYSTLQSKWISGYITNFIKCL